jgi:hypothetical protein
MGIVHIANDSFTLWSSFMSWTLKLIASVEPRRAARDLLSGRKFSVDLPV